MLQLVFIPVILEADDLVTKLVVSVLLDNTE